jgi:hypothetical protein
MLPDHDNLWVGLHLLNSLDIVCAHLPKVPTRWNERIRVLAMFYDTTNSDFVLLAPCNRLARFTSNW